jgi:hypothetical protein
MSEKAYRVAPTDVREIVAGRTWKDASAAAKQIFGSQRNG